MSAVVRFLRELRVISLVMVRVVRESYLLSSCYELCSLVFFRTTLRPILAFFFFQAEDGIRALYVTRVQTCALPIPPLRYLSASAPFSSSLANSPYSAKTVQ